MPFILESPFSLVSYTDVSYGVSSSISEDAGEVSENVNNDVIIPGESKPAEESKLTENSTEESKPEADCSKYDGYVIGPFPKVSGTHKMSWKKWVNMLCTSPAAQTLRAGAT